MRVFQYKTLFKAVGLEGSEVAARIEICTPFSSMDEWVGYGGRRAGAWC